jgi:hypothetical protein
LRGQPQEPQFREQEKAGNDAMSAVFENFGVSFMYPENWNLEDVSGDLDAGPKTVTVNSPTGGFWSLQVYEPAVDPQPLVDQFRLTMEAEYEGLESHPTEEEVGEVKWSGYDLDFYYLDFVVSARVRSARVGKRTYVLSCQAETRDFDKLAPVFDAMTYSLLHPQK